MQLHAGLGQTLLALVPLATLLLAVAQRQERLRTAAIVGTVLGLGGVALISIATLQHSAAVVSVIAVLGSVFCFAEAAVLVRRFPRVHPVAMNAVGMAAAVAVLLALSALAGEPHPLPQRLTTWVALGYVSMLGSVVVFLLYVYVLHHWSASRASYVMVLIPFVTVVLSAWLDNEPVGVSLLLGGALVLIGVYVGALRHRAE